MNTNYFKFTSNNKRLSKQDLNAILKLELKNGTLDSDLFRNEIFWFYYLDKYSIEITFNVLAKYKQESNDNYIARFVYYDDKIHKDCENLIIKASQIKLLNTFNEEDIEKIRNVYTFKPIDNDQILNYYIDLFTSRCIYSYIMNDYSIENWFDSIFNSFMMDLRTYQEKQVMISFKNKFYDFFNDEFGDCYNKIKKYFRNENLRSQYNKLSD